MCGGVAMHYLRDALGFFLLLLFLPLIIFWLSDGSLDDVIEMLLVD
jgi:hypothetical protein